MGLSKAEVGLQPTFSSAKIGFAKGRMLAPFSPPKKGTHQQKKDKNSSHRRQKNTKKSKKNQTNSPQKKCLIQKLEFQFAPFTWFLKKKTHRIFVKTPGEVPWCHDADGWSWEKAWEGHQNHRWTHGNLRGVRPQCQLRAWSPNKVLIPWEGWWHWGWVGSLGFAWYVGRWTCCCDVFESREDQSIVLGSSSRF